MSDIEPIRFIAQTFKLQTLVDGGYRLTLDLLPPTSDDAVMALMKTRQPGIVLECAAVAVDVKRLEEPESEKEYGL